MRNGTDRNAKKIAPILCAAVIILFLLAYLAVLIYPMLTVGDSALVVVLVLGLYALIVLAVICGVLLALRQRLREIRSGEEEDAKKY